MEQHKLRVESMLDLRGEASVLFAIIGVLGDDAVSHRARCIHCCLKMEGMRIEVRVRYTVSS